MSRTRDIGVECNLRYRNNNNNNNRGGINSSSDNVSSSNNIELDLPSEQPTDDYAEATGFFIRTGIDYGREVIRETHNFVEFTKRNINEMIFWSRLYRYIYIIKEIVNIIKIIYELLL